MKHRLDQSILVHCLTHIDSENIWILNQNRELVFINQALMKYTDKFYKIDIDDYIGLELDEVLVSMGVDDTSRELIRRTDFMVLQGVLPFAEMVETVVVSGDKRVFKTQKWAVNHEGETYLVGIALNVTLEYFERERSALLLEQLKRSENAKSRFLKGIKHDLNTPLANIKGITSILKTRSMDAESKDLIKHLSSSADHLSQLMEGLLAYTEYKDLQGELNSSVVDIAALFDDVLSVYRLKADEKQLLLKCSVVKEGITIVTDALKLKRILSNLVSNAIKYTFHGEVHLACDLIVSGEANHLELSVKDTGIGIAHDQLEAIFEPMYRGVDAEYFPEYGLGLGLDVVKQLVKQIGGHISVSSQLEKGSRFALRLPYHMNKHSLV